MSRYYEDDYRPRRKRKPGLGDWLFVIALTLIGIGVVVVSAPTAINLYLAYQNAAAVPTATQPALATAAVPTNMPAQYQPIQQQPIATTAPDPQTATDIAAAQQRQPDDYQEMTKPNTRVLPTLEPKDETHTQEQIAPISPVVANEGSKPARHKP